MTPARPARARAQLTLSVPPTRRGPLRHGSTPWGRAWFLLRAAERTPAGGLAECLVPGEHAGSVAELLARGLLSRAERRGAPVLVTLPPPDFGPDRGDDA